MRSAGNFNPEWGYLAPVPSFMRTLRIVLAATAIGAAAGAAVVVALIDHPALNKARTAAAAHAIVTSVQAAPTAAIAPALKVAPEPAVSAEAVPPSAAAPNAMPAAVAQPVTSPAQARPAATVFASPDPPAAQSAVPDSPVHDTAAASGLSPSSDVASTAAAVTPTTPAASSEAAVVSPPPSAPAAAASSSHEATASDARASDAKPAPAVAALTDSKPVEAPRAEEADRGLIPPESIPPEKKAKHRGSTYAANEHDRAPPSLGSVLRRLFTPPQASRSNYPSR